MNKTEKTRTLKSLQNIIRLHTPPPETLDAPSGSIALSFPPEQVRNLYDNHLDVLTFVQRVANVQFHHPAYRPDMIFVTGRPRKRLRGVTAEQRRLFANQGALALEALMDILDKNGTAEPAMLVPALLKITRNSASEALVKNALVREKLLEDEREPAAPVPVIEKEKKDKKPKREKPEKPQKQKKAAPTRKNALSADGLVSKRQRKQVLQDVVLPHTPFEETEQIEALAIGSNPSCLFHLDHCPKTGQYRLNVSFITPQVIEKPALVFDRKYRNEAAMLDKDPGRSSRAYYRAIKRLYGVEQLSTMRFDEQDYKPAITVRFLSPDISEADALDALENPEKYHATTEIAVTRARMAAHIPFEVANDHRSTTRSEAYSNIIPHYNQITPFADFVNHRLAARAGAQRSTKRAGSRPDARIECMVESATYLARVAAQQALFKQNIPAIHRVQDYPRKKWEELVHYLSTETVIRKNLPPASCSTYFDPAHESFLLNAGAMLHRMTTGTDLVSDELAQQIGKIHHQQIQSGFRLDKAILDPNPCMRSESSPLYELHKQFNQASTQEKHQP